MKSCIESSDAAVASNELMPLKQLSRIMKSMPTDLLQSHISNYDLCEGNLTLREELSKRMLGLACSISTQDIITTNGCLEAVSLCLRAVANPGDTILVQSPVFHCFLQLIEDLNLYVIEIPGCPEKGIDPTTLNETIASNKIKNQTSAIAIAVSKYFPSDTQITFTRGGMFIWVVLNRKIDSMKIYQKAYEKKISILPGTICSSSDKYKNCLRINCGVKWSQHLEEGIKTLGQIIKTL